MQKTILLVVIGAGIIVAGAWYFISSNGPLDKESVGEEDVVARINDEDITRSDFEAYKKQTAAGQGFDIASLSEEERRQLQEYALDALVSRALVKQAAAKAGITVSEADIDAQMETVKGQFESDAAYQSALSQEGLSESELRSQIAADMLIEAYIEQALDLDSITATEEEIEAEYQQAAAAHEGFPELSEVRGQIESSIIQEKQQQIISQHIQGLQAEADIEILI